MRHPTELDAFLAFLVATGIAALLTPVTIRLARAVGAVDEPRERGLAVRATPLLGGLAIFAAAAVAGAIYLPGTRLWHGIFYAAAVITVVGAIDDRMELPALVKLAGQLTAAITAVRFGVVVHNITLPFIGAVDFAGVGPTLTVIWLVAMMNVVNFSDGVDGLAAGVCAIIAAALAVIAFDLGKDAGGVLAALIAGSALGFLFWNLPPARSFMGDCGANLLGLLMGCLTVEGSLKKAVVVSVVLPLILLAVPFLDTTFVVLKRLKYGRPIYAADSEHFHHRMARIGFSRRRTIGYLYAWTVMLAGLALALRFVPYSDHHGHLHAGWSIVLSLIFLFVFAASVYLVYVLEILKFRRLAAITIRRARPAASSEEVERAVTEKLETGEWEAVTGNHAAAVSPRPASGETPSGPAASPARHAAPRPPAARPGIPVGAPPAGPASSAR